MYYRLDDRYTFRGWKKLPYAIRAAKGPEAYEKPWFFDKKTFMILLGCNGEEKVDEADLSEESGLLLDKLVRKGVLKRSETPLAPLHPYQRYKVYPGIYLESVHWSITGRCNYRCRHCLVSAPAGIHPELSFEECLRIVDQISSLGIRKVDLTGGEPLVRSDFLELAEALSRRGILINVIFSNGSLITEDLLDELAKRGQHPAFQLSLDGIGHHDWLRGISGAEARLVETIRLLERRGIPYACGMCIHKENAASLPDTVRFLAEHGCQSLRLNTPQDYGEWREYAERYALGLEEAWAIFREYIPQYFRDGMPINIWLDGFFSCRKGAVSYRIPFVHHYTEGVDLNRCPGCESMLHNAHISAEGRLLPCMGFAAVPELSDRFPSLLSEEAGPATLSSFYAEVAGTTLTERREHNAACSSCAEFLRCACGCMAAELSGCDHLQADRHTCAFHKRIGEAEVRRIADDAISKYVYNKTQKENGLAAKSQEV